MTDMPSNCEPVLGTSGKSVGMAYLFASWSRRIIVTLLVSYVSLLAIGIAWWVANLNTMPAYGDTSQYFELATSLRVDQYRTLFYPLLLRGLQGIAPPLNSRMELLLYLLQTAVALLSVAYLGRAFWDVTAETGRFAFLARVSPTIRRFVIGTSSVVVFTAPLTNHFALSVLTDSLAASLTTAGVAALVRIAVLGDTRLRTGILGWLSIGAAGFMRAEKIELFALVGAMTVVIVVIRGRCMTPLRSNPSRGQRLRVIAVLAALLLTASAAVLALNWMTQTADYGWPPLTVSVRLFVRTAWPRLADIRPLLSTEAQRVVSAADAERFDGNYNEYLSLVPRLRRAAGNTDHLVNEISLAALRHRGADIAISTALDALRYAAPMIAYPADLVMGARTASSWTDSRMRMAHPSLTHAYLVIATTVLVAVQLPLLCALLICWGGRDSRITFTVVLTVGVALVNGVLYAMGNGLQNVRYALPANMLGYAVTVWANAAVLLLLWRAKLSIPR